MTDYVLANDLHPILPESQYVTEFEYAYGLHQAAGNSRLLNNRTINLDPVVLAQRKQLIEITTALLLKERDKALDKFCTSWLKYRSLPIPALDAQE